MAAAAELKPHPPQHQASQVRLALKMKYREITYELQADDLKAELWAEDVITEEDYENLEREKEQRGLTSQAKLLIKKMLTKCDTDVEQFKAILLKHQPEIKHLLEENINEKLIQNIASRLRQLLRRRNSHLVQALPGESFQLDLHRTEYNMPLDFSVKERKEGPYGRVYNYESVYFKSLNDIVISLLENDSLHSVLCEGIAGIGKSIYGQQVLCAWVDEKKPISFYYLVFLIPVRNIDITASIIDILGKSSAGLGLITDDVKDALHHCLQDETIANKILFIFDGIDEKEIQPESELSQIICGQKYPHIKLMVTARPEASFLRQSKTFHPHFKVHLLGTNKLGVYGYLKAVMQTDHQIPDPMAIDRLIEKLECSMVEFELLFIPLYLTLVSILFSDHWVKHLSFTNFKLPNTVTRLFNMIMHIFLRKWLIRDGYIEQANALQFDTNPIKSTSNLPNRFKSKLVNLGKISYDLLLKKRYTFDTELLPDYHIDRGDLFNSGLFCTSEEGEDIVCFYRHKTLQEFMSALYLSHERGIIHAHVDDFLQSKKSDPIFLSDIFSRLEVVAQFLFGMDGALTLELLNKIGGKLALVKQKARQGDIQISFESSLFSEIQDDEAKQKMLKLLIEANVVRKDIEDDELENTKFSFADLCQALSDDEKRLLLNKWFYFKMLKSGEMYKIDSINLSYCNKVFIMLHGMEFPNIKEIHIKESGLAHIGLLQNIFLELQKLQIDEYEYNGNEDVASRMLDQDGIQNIPPILVGNPSYGAQNIHTLTHITVRSSLLKAYKVLDMNTVKPLTSQSQLQSLILSRVDILPNIRQVINTGTCFWAHLMVLELYVFACDEETGINQVENLMWLVENHTQNLQALTFAVPYMSVYDSVRRKLSELIQAQANKPHFAQLTTLRLYQVLDDEGVTQLCGVLPQIKPLTTLGLFYKHLESEDVCRTLIQTLSNCPSITHIHIGYCYGEKKEAQLALKQFAKRCKKLPEKIDNFKFRIHDYFGTRKCLNYEPEPGCSIQ